MNKVISREYVEKNYIHKDKIKKRYEQLKHYDYIETKELLKLLEGTEDEQIQKQESSN